MIAKILRGMLDQHKEHKRRKGIAFKAFSELENGKALENIVDTVSIYKNRKIMRPSISAISRLLGSWS